MESSIQPSPRITIYILDNASLPNDLQILQRISHPKVKLIALQNNTGYAVGNNTAAKVAMEEFSPDFIVVMNPDIELVSTGTIESIIEAIQEGGSGVVGAQPKIDAFRLATDGVAHVSLRRVPDLWDLVIIESIFLRFIFKARIRKFQMEDARPYTRDTKFFVPSGAFFVIRATTFQEIGGFDESTFLYGEEFILGKKLEERKEFFLLDPRVTVSHFQGASTKFDRWLPNRKMYKYRRESILYYTAKYLRVGIMERTLLVIAMELGYITRSVIGAIDISITRISSFWGLQKPIN